MSDGELSDHNTLDDPDDHVPLDLLHQDHEDDDGGAVAGSPGLELSDFDIHLASTRR